MNKTINTTDSIEQKYELAVFLKDGDEQNKEAIEKLMRDFDIKITRVDGAKRVSLAYKINKEAFANLIVFEIYARTDIINKFSRELRVGNYTLRFFIVKNPANKEALGMNTEYKRDNYEYSSTKQEVVENKESVADSHKTITNAELEKKLEEILK